MSVSVRVDVCVSVYRKTEAADQKLMYLGRNVLHCDLEMISYCDV